LKIAGLRITAILSSSSPIFAVEQSPGPPAWLQARPYGDKPIGVPRRQAPSSDPPVPERRAWLAEGRMRPLHSDDAEVVIQ